MAIEVRPYKKKDGTVSWYVYVNGKNVKKSGLVAAGFSPSLSFQEARARAEQLNAQNKLKYHAERRLAIADRLETERLEALAFLPASDIMEFENSVLAPKFLSKTTWDHKHKLATKWRAAIETMKVLKLDPSDWADKPFIFYNYFLGKQFSPGYVERIIALMNLYGYFYCRRYKKPFAPVPPLKGVARQKQFNAYRSKPGRRHKSDRITAAELEAIREPLRDHPQLFNWIFISLWLGLRPEEVDSLKEPLPGYEHYFETQDDIKILVIYQSKLIHSVDEAERWKRIPILYPEQKEALRLIKEGNFKRPLPKTMQGHLGKKHADTYTGRKSFTDLMLSLGQRLEDIQGWMGHTSIERTWKDYKNRKQVHFIKPSSKRPKKAS